MTDKGKTNSDHLGPFLEKPSPERFEAVLSSISDGVFTVDKNWRITCFNRAAQEITGYGRAQAMGRPCHEILRANICPDACALRYTMETGNPVASLVVQITTKSGSVVPVSISTALFRNKQGAIIGGVETFRDLRQIERLRKKLEKQYSSEDIIGKSQAIRAVLEILPTVAESPSTVLVCGESGTGKELVARAIHKLSKNSKGPFVAFNCANYPDTLIDSELFGHEKGAFTGAVQTRHGRFAQAQDGTLFLDEIGDLPLPTQAKLLRVLQEKVYEPLGSGKSRQTNARIVSATNRDLESMVEKGTFRKDLYYRINVIKIRCPALRERMEDVPLLIRHFVGNLAALHGKHIVGLSPGAMGILMEYRFPGNVRELENIIEHGFVLSNGRLIHTEHLPKHLTDKGIVLSANESLADCERKIILNALKSNGYNRIATAKALGVHKSTFFRKVKRLGLSLPDLDGRSAKN